jgi:hypothetical protein
MREIVSDALILAGLSAIVYAAWQLSPAAAWAVGGVAAVVYGVMIDSRRPGRLR